MIEVYIVSGFLGAGKTTLINYLLEDQSLKKTMLIENEFGEKSIDDKLFGDKLEVFSINSGCICCSLKGELKDALDEIRSYAIDTLFIEPSGVGKLSEIIATINKEKDFKLVSHVTLVNGLKAISYHKNFKEFFDDQVIMANMLILTRVEKLDEKKKLEVVKMLSELNEDARILTSPYRHMGQAKLLSLMKEGACACEDCTALVDDEELEKLTHHEHHHHHHHHHHDADEVFTSLALYPCGIFDEESLRAVLSKLDDYIIRAKGYLHTDIDKDLYFSCSDGEIDIWYDKKQAQSEVVLIGSNLDEKGLKELFNA